jgi:hypothetical protein
VDAMRVFACAEVCLRVLYAMRGMRMVNVTMHAMRAIHMMHTLPDMHVVRAMLITHKVHMITFLPVMHAIHE